MTDLSYKVAGHLFRLSFPKHFFEEDRLTNYRPFRVKEDSGDYLFHLSVVEDLTVEEESYTELGHFDDDIASIGIAKSNDGQSFCFHIVHPQGAEHCILEVDCNFREARVVLPVANSSLRFFYINNCVMLLYAFATARLGTLLIHASVIGNDGAGYVFLGKSGTGKSTHSRLWLEHIAGSSLLNDDNPVVRIVDGKAQVYGSPWSGKTPCYRNKSLRLDGIVKLHQAPENQIAKLSVLQAYAAVFPSCSCMKWEEEMMAGVHHTVEQLATSVACYRLDCLPDQEAAELCATTAKWN